MNKNKRQFESIKEENMNHGLIWCMIGNYIFLIFFIIIISFISSYYTNADQYIGSRRTFFVIACAYILNFIITIIPATIIRIVIYKINFPFYINVPVALLGSFMGTAAMILCFHGAGHTPILHPLVLLSSLMFVVYPYKILKSEFSFRSLNI